MSVKLKISEPMVAALGDTYEKIDWGPYQYPDLFVGDDGEWIVSCQNAADEIESIGKKRLWFVSRDQGASWTQITEKDESDALDVLGMIKLPSGDRITPDPHAPLSVKALAAQGKELPPPSYLSPFHSKVYLLSEIPDDILKKGWYFYRLHNGKLQSELAEVRWPYMNAWVLGDSLVVPLPYSRMHLFDNGELWITHYEQGSFAPEDGKPLPYAASYFFRSFDEGKSWVLQSYIPFFPEDFPDDPLVLHREGFTEPEMTVLPDGSYLALLRTDGNHHHTGNFCYWARSEDGGKSWSKPQVFDKIGVFPCLLTLKCGVTLASYGRPGVYLRATDDPAGMAWDDPIELVTPGKDHTKDADFMRSCSYTKLVALDERTALLAYSNFFVPDEKGVRRKGILVRKITVEE